jgi:hypothetical protein
MALLFRIYVKAGSSWADYQSALLTQEFEIPQSGFQQLVDSSRSLKMNPRENIFVSMIKIN